MLTLANLAVDGIAYGMARFIITAGLTLTLGLMRFVNLNRRWPTNWRCWRAPPARAALAAQRVVQLIGMDKASVSRCFKSMAAQGLIAIEADAADGRLRHARFTPRGRALHDRIRHFALLREQVFHAVLTADETRTLLDLLARLHANLGAVEAASDAFMAQERLSLPAELSVELSARRLRRKPAPADRQSTP